MERPYRWYGTGDDSLFDQPEPQQSGLYLWTIPFENQYLTYYTFETGRSFRVRFTEHTRDYLYGLYRIYNPALFARGEKNLVWEGMWKRGTKERMGEFLNRYRELAPQVSELLGLFRVFLAPLSADKRIRQRIEAVLYDHLCQQSGVVGAFQDPDITYWRARYGETPISVTLTASASILGLPQTLEA